MHLEVEIITPLRAADVGNASKEVMRKCKITLTTQVKSLPYNYMTWGATDRKSIEPFLDIIRRVLTERLPP